MRDHRRIAELMKGICTWFDMEIAPQSHAEGTLKKAAEEMAELMDAHVLLKAHEQHDTGVVALLEHQAKRDEEAADVFIAFVAYCHIADIDLDAAVAEKMKINRARVWGPPDADGVRRHV